MRTRLPRAALAAALLLAVPAPARAEDPPPKGPPPPAPAPPAADERGRVGFTPFPVRGLSPDQREEWKLARESGTVVGVVLPGGPAAKAGVVAGDVLLRYRGKPVPDDAGVDGAEGARAWAAKFQALTEGTKVGDAVEFVVEREGKPVTLVATAVGPAEIAALGGVVATPAAAPAPDAVPAPSTAGEAREAAEGFDAAAGDALPAGFRAVSGRWRVVAASAGEGGAAAAGNVLRQDRPVDPWAVLLVTGEGRAYGDGRVSVRLRPVSGEVDASGGIVFRARDAENHYLVRANALEGNLRLYKVERGVRATLASVEVKAPALGAWHALEVTFTGSAIRATLDGGPAVEAKDETFASGWTGLWTKADAVTEFDDWKAAPAAKPATK